MSKGIFERAGAFFDSILSSQDEAPNERQFESRSGSAENRSPELTIVKHFLNGMGDDVQVCPAKEDFSYKDILLWASQNKVGDSFYVVKYVDKKTAAIWLCVCFAKDKKLLTDHKYPKICYVLNQIPESIQNLFGNSTTYIQPFK